MRGDLPIAVARLDQTLAALGRVGRLLRGATPIHPAGHGTVRSGAGWDARVALDTARPPMTSTSRCSVRVSPLPSRCRAAGGGYSSRAADLAVEAASTAAAVAK